MVPSARTLHSSAAGWSSQVARRAHNPKVRGSNPLPATKLFEACQLAGRPQTIWWPCRIWEERSDGSSPRIAGCVRSDGSSLRMEDVCEATASLTSAIDAVVVGFGCVIHECGEPINKSHPVHFFGVELITNSNGVVVAGRDPVRDVHTSGFDL